MEARVILRGALSGFIAGLLGFAFARIFAEPYIDKAIAYEDGRDAAITAVDKAAGVTVNLDGPTYFSRTIQQNIGIATGIVVFSTAMGALVAVVYLVLHGRFNVRPRTLGLLVAGFGFLGVYLMPFVKYPANPPSIGHDFTIATRGHLYLAMVGGSILFLIIGVVLARQLQVRFGNFNSILLAGTAVLVLFCVLMAVLPSLGHLAANKAQEGSVGYGKSATETPLPITDAHGRIVYPGFPADVLWKFRFYSVVAQLLIWSAIGLIFSNLVERVVGSNRPRLDRRSDPASATA
jgi:hypothetical protein